MIVETVKWIGGTDGVLEMIDQRRLPAEFVKLKVRSVEQLHEAIRTLAVRGAPAIGVAAAYGPVLALAVADRPAEPAGGLGPSAQGLRLSGHLPPHRRQPVLGPRPHPRQGAGGRRGAAGDGATACTEALLAEANAI